MDTPAGVILVGYDGSSDSELALAWADQLAHDHDKPLRVLISEVDPTQVLEATSDWHQAKMAQLEADVRERLDASRAPDHGFEVVSVPPSEALIAASERCAVVVVGARGHSLLSGVVLGSVSQHVARHAACPAIVVRQPYDPASRRVVVGVDGSGGSRAALEFGFDHASRTGGSLTAIHAWKNVARSRGRNGGHPLQSLSDEVSVSERILADSLRGLPEKYPDVKVNQEAIPVAPHRVLADASQSASLVVVGSRGLGAFAGLLLGSVSQSLLHHAECPVAIVR